MPKLSSIIQYAAHPQELRAMIQWKLWHEPVHARDASEESANLKRCYHFLHMTSRSFAAVIRELHPELLVPVCVFYLVLRGLDTIEDDMTIDIKQKDELLRQFATRLEQPGWTFDGNGLDEDDRQLLVEFDCVITEFANVKSAYRVIIKDICQRMGDGMADFAWKGNDQDYRVESVQEYELYCHYVAGLVGEGLTRLFVEAKLADPALLGRKDLYESMGQMLQQTNIIRDVREDRDDKRYFWPREIWSRHVEDYEDLFKPENSEIAMQCQTEMILHAIRRGSDCLHYLSGLREQSVFNFCAIPQSMALATLDRCFRNKDMFQRNVKIRRGEACMLMMESTQNLRIVTNVFKRHVRSIHKKNSPTDPNFLAVSIACAKVETFIESMYPSTGRAPKSGPSTAEADKRLADEQEAKRDMVYIGLAIFGTFAFLTLCMIGVAWFFGARLDLAWDQLKRGSMNVPGTVQEAQALMGKYGARKQEL